jgi:hypothetical protein
LKKSPAADSVLVNDSLLAGRDMLGRKERYFFITGSLRQLIPDDHVLVRVDGVLNLSWLREEVSDCYCLDDGRPGVDPEVAVRLMLAGLLSCVGECEVNSPSNLAVDFQRSRPAENVVLRQPQKRPLCCMELTRGDYKHFKTRKRAFPQCGTRTYELRRHRHDFWGHHD